MRVRSLRTQQRTDSQCQLVSGAGFLSAVVVVVGGYLVAGYCFFGTNFRASFLLVFGPVICVGLFRRISSLLIGRPALVGCVVIRHSMESLILAQDERWRRA